MKEYIFNGIEKLTIKPSTKTYQHENEFVLAHLSGMIRIN